METTGPRKRRVQAIMSAASSEEPSSALVTPQLKPYLDVPAVPGHFKTMSGSSISEPLDRQVTEMPSRDTGPPLNSTTAREITLPSITDIQAQVTDEAPGSANASSNMPMSPRHNISSLLAASGQGELLRKGSFLGFSTIAPPVVATAAGNGTGSGTNSSPSTSPRLSGNNKAAKAPNAPVPPPSNQASNLMEMTSADFISAMKDQPVANHSLFARGGSKAHQVSNQSLTSDPIVEAALGESLRRLNSVVNINTVSPSHSPRELKSRATSMIHGPSSTSLANIPSTPSSTNQVPGPNFGSASIAARSLSFANRNGMSSVSRDRPAVGNSRATTPRATATNLATERGSSDDESEVTASVDGRTPRQARTHERVASAAVTRTNSGTSQSKQGAPLPSPSYSGVTSGRRNTGTSIVYASPAPTPRATGYTSSLPAGTLITGQAAVAVQQEIQRQERLRQHQQQGSSVSTTKGIEASQSMTPTSDKSSPGDPAHLELTSPLRDLSSAAISGSFAAFKGVMGGLGSVVGSLGSAVSSASFSSIVPAPSEGSSATSSLVPSILHYATLLGILVLSYAFALVGWQADLLLELCEENQRAMVDSAFTRGTNVTGQMLITAARIETIDTEAAAVGEDLLNSRAQLSVIENAAKEESIWAAGGEDCPVLLAPLSSIFCYPTSPAPRNVSPSTMAELLAHQERVKDIELALALHDRDREDTVAALKALHGSQLDIIYALSALMYTEEVLAPADGQRHDQGTVDPKAEDDPSMDFDALKCHLCVQNHLSIGAPTSAIVGSCAGQEKGSVCSVEAVEHCAKRHIVRSLTAFSRCIATSRKGPDSSHAKRSDSDLWAKIEKEIRTDPTYQHDSTTQAHQAVDEEAVHHIFIPCKGEDECERGPHPTTNTRRHAIAAPTLSSIVGGADIERSLVASAMGIAAAASAAQKVEAALEEHRRKVLALAQSRIRDAMDAKARQQQVKAAGQRKEEQERKEQIEHDRTVELAKLRHDSEMERLAQLQRMKDLERQAEVELESARQHSPQSAPKKVVLRSSVISAHRHLAALFTPTGLYDAAWRGAVAAMWVAERSAELLDMNTMEWASWTAWIAPSDNTKDFASKSQPLSQPKSFVWSLLENIGALRPCQQLVTLLGSKGSALLLILLGFAWLHWSRQY